MLFIFLRIALLQTVVLSTADFSFNRLLKTNQYIIISQQLCQTKFESHVNDQSCPRAFIPISSAQQKSVSVCIYPIRIHLIRDPEKRRPPRALYVGRHKSGQTIAFVEDIATRFAKVSIQSSMAPRLPSFDRTSNIYSRLIDFSNRPHKYMNQYNTDFTLYDHVYQLLYLVNHDSRGMQHCAVLRLSNLFPGSSESKTLTTSLIHDFVIHEANKARNGWIEDPYSHEVYYTTSEEGNTYIHALPMNRILSAFKEGTAGRKIYMYSNDRIFLSVFGGVLITQHSQGDHTIFYMRSTTNSSKNVAGISCGFAHDRGSDGNASNPYIMIVRDWDYCQIRDGPLADPRTCLQDREQWMLKEGLKSNSPDLLFGALLIVLIILITLLLLLVLYICWLRRSLDDTFEEVPQRPNFAYYPNPYQPDMDVSVDRWNY